MKQSTREWAVVGGVVVVVALVIVLGLRIFGGGDSGQVAGGGDGTSAPTPSAAPAEGAPQADDEYGRTTDAFGLAVGPEDAPHEVVIYEDFLCPACGALEASTNDQLTAAVDAGDVRVEYRPMNLLAHVGDYSARAANAFAAVTDTTDAQTAKTFHDLLFANQPSESGGMPDDDFLVDLAVQAGADEATVRPLIEDMTFGDWVDDATDAANQVGVRSTPTVYLDGTQVQGQSIAEVSSAIMDGIG